MQVNVYLSIDKQNVTYSSSIGRDGKSVYEGAQVHSNRRIR